MLKISDYLYVDKKHIVRQIVEDILKSIAPYLDIDYLNIRNDVHVYVEEDHTGKDRLFLVKGWKDFKGNWHEESSKIISENESDINKYHTAYNLMQLYKI